ncbi:MAG: hypothetical protein KBG84_13375 [Planctomycetes bacterium]|nr:hypothetical protein [Planctomycetota bacterium]
MSVGITLLFVEKRAEAVRLCAALTEPFATGSVPGHEADLMKDYKLISERLRGALDELKECSKQLDTDKSIEPGDVRNGKQRVGTIVQEIARCAQDFAAQVRFFQAMNPKHAPASVPYLKAFEDTDRATRELIGEDTSPAEGEELAPAESEPAPPDADPMLM